MILELLSIMNILDIHTHEFAMYEMLTNKSHFPYFQEVIEKYFVDNYERISKKLTELSKWDGKTVKDIYLGT